MFLYKQEFLPRLETAVLNFQDDRRTVEHMVQCDLLPFLHAEKANIPTLGHRFFVMGGEGNRGQMPHICPGSPPLGLNIDRCITKTQYLVPSGRISLPDIVLQLNPDHFRKHLSYCLYM